MRVIGIETSCDETGVAIYDSDKGLIADLLHSQVQSHKKFGGVVPEIASRDHIRKTIPMIHEALAKANCSAKSIDGIAYTAGPGLIGALLVGSSVAKSLALAWGIPALGIHHMEGHLLAANLSSKPPSHPFVALLVSGGHTQLMRCEDYGNYKLLGESVDDAAGEAFDKVAKMLGLGYPGGPEIAKAAREGNSSRFTFPRPMTNKPGLNFSFSGLKTFVLNTINDLNQLNQQDIADVACAFEHAVVDTIRIKCERAMEQTGLDSLVIAGGVSANQHLRKILGIMTNTSGCKLYYPETNLCTDNGAMIAYAGYQRLVAGQTETLEIKVRPRWPLDELETM